MIVLLIISIIILAITLITVAKHQRYLESYHQELQHTLEDCQAVKAELEKLMHEAVHLSDEMVSRLERSAAESNQPKPEDNSMVQVDEAAETMFISPNERTVYIGTSIPSIPQDQDSNPEMPDLYYEVISLYQKGYSIKEIASQLNRGQGEVSLILNITSKRKAI